MSLYEMTKNFKIVRENRFKFNQINNFKIKIYIIPSSISIC